MTPTTAAAPRVEAARQVAAAVARGAALIAFAALLILGFLPAALGAAGPQVPIAG